MGDKESGDKESTEKTKPRLWRGKVDSISQYGLGVASIAKRKDNKTLRRPLFVPFTVPGDEVEVEVTEERGKYSFGELRALLTPSEQRTMPRCSHFGVCGGCNLLHVSYEAQLAEKAKMIAFLLERREVKAPHEITVLPSKQRHNYRWRSRIALRFQEGRVVAGFRKFRSHDIVAVSSCLIVDERILELIRLLNRTPAAESLKAELECSVIVDEKGRLRLLVALDDVAKKERQKVKEHFDTLPGKEKALAAIFFEEENVRSPAVIDYATYSAAGMSFSYLPWTFIQGNVPTNETLIATALSFIKGDRVLDLYCGIGNLTLPIAKQGIAAIGVDGDEECIRLAKLNAEKNMVENVTFVHEPVERYLETNQRFDTIILDPPRTGCTPAVLDGLLKHGAARIVYVSCNPITLADDLAKLKEGYALFDVKAVDMFPDISHVEVVAVLEKK
jgi:23S rRNA (uracil1939-C5)-methyltransferase